MTFPVLPESAPFTSAQRAWLNGFFAGLLGLDDGTNVAIAGSPAAVLAVAPSATLPWSRKTSPGTTQRFR
jgi:sulfite reductase (NADPH) flavoprotein alpha-component